MYQIDFSFINSSNMVRNLDLYQKGFTTSSLETLDLWISENYGLCKNSYYILFNGKKIDLLGKDLKPDEGKLHVIPRTFGGKGGFGSMLRAIGAQIEKTTNREACRDLSGRRLRDINEEQRLKNWIAQQTDREREAEERKKKKLERLCQEPKHDFKDEKYDQSRSTMSEEMSSSVEQGFKASTSVTVSHKRKHSNKECRPSVKPPMKKKKNLWIDEDESDSSSSEITENEVKFKVCGNNKLVLAEDASQNIKLS